MRIYEDLRKEEIAFAKGILHPKGLAKVYPGERAGGGFLIEEKDASALIFMTFKGLYPKNDANESGKKGAEE